MLFRSLFCTAALALAVPAFAADNVPAAGPPVADGDLGCVIASGMMAMLAGKAADDTKKSEKDRQSAATLRQKSYEDNAFYLGRLSMLPAERRTSAAYLAAFENFSKLDTDKKVAYIAACNDWAKDSKIGMVKPWTGK